MRPRLMQPLARILAAAWVLVGIEPCAAVAAEAVPEFTATEIARLLRHGPWPPPVAPDPSNRVSGTPEAIALGRALFFDQHLSPDGALSCAACHDPARAWTDGRAHGEGRAPLPRNTMSLYDLRYLRWFGWDGHADSLWAASLAPILAAKELAGSLAHTATLLRTDAVLAAGYARTFGRAATDVGDEALAIDAAKALAAFQETLVSPPTRFDRFRDALAVGDTAAAAAALSPSAQRGARLFVGRGNCALCHQGPSFTNREFHDIGVKFFTADGADPGRHGGIKALRASPYTLLGVWNDDPTRAPGTATRHLDPQHRNFGEFRVPSLRGVARTAPYMHNGTLASLRDVVRHYSALDPDRLHADGEAILQPLRLDGGEIDDLVAFLEALDWP